MLGVRQCRPSYGAHRGRQFRVDFDCRAVRLSLNANHANIGTPRILRVPLGTFKTGTGKLEDILNGYFIIGLIE